MKRISILLAGCGLALSAALPARADVLFSQTADNLAKWYSQTSSGTSGAHTVYDDFTLGSAATVSLVSWTGLTFPVDSITGVSFVDSFTISFYQDSGSNTPGAFMTSFLISGNANETSGGANVGSYALFDYSAPVNFAAEKDTEYWISIVADAPGALWGWSNATGPNPNMYQDNGSTLGGVPVLDNRTTDLAFTLSNASAVPEPSSLVFVGTGILAMAGVVRRYMAAR